jgi:hypothetical protein
VAEAGFTTAGWKLVSMAVKLRRLGRGADPAFGTRFFLQTTAGNIAQCAVVLDS